MSEITRRIVGTAGHIDHGKTALVKALTGIDCDRLPEEKKRGITIDLGFANLRIGDLQIGFVDVPGHERFVKNMLAGAGGIDAVILVVAADESIKPQTREHLAICELLAVRQGVIALTKADLVDEEMLEVVRAEVRDLVGDTFLADAPIVPVSSVDGRGIDELRNMLETAVSEAPKRDIERRPFRLPIDRVFSIHGFGTVVTGTLISGSIARDGEFEILPLERRSRARSIEVHGESREKAFAGERTSLNVADASVDELHRGQQLIAPHSFATSSLITVDLSLLDSSGELKDQSRVRLHHYSAELLGRLRLLDEEQRSLASGERAFAQIILEAPIVAAAGDRFVIRRYSPATTIGGGVIIDTQLSRLPRSTRPEILQRLTNGSLVEKIETMLRMAGSRGLTTHALAQRHGLIEAEISRAIRAAKNEALIEVSDGLWIHRDSVQQLHHRAMELLTDYFKQQKMTVGLPKGEFLQKILPAESDPRLAGFLIDDLVRQKIVVVDGDRIDVPGRSKQLGGAEGELARIIEETYRKAGLQTPAVSELIKAIPQKPKVIEGVISFLVKSGTLVRLAEGVYLHRDILAEARVKMKERSGSTIDVGAFKDFFSISRKIAIPLLEHFDRTGVTKRQGDQRLVL